MARSQANTMVMLETRAGSPNGIDTIYFEAGKTYTTTERLFKMFIANGWATVPVAEVEEKMLTPVTENKMVAPAKVVKADTIADREEAAKKAKGTATRR